MKGTKAEVWKQLEEAQKKIQELEREKGDLTQKIRQQDEWTKFLTQQKVANLEELTTKIKNLESEPKKIQKAQQKDQERIQDLEQQITALRTDKNELLTKVVGVNTTDQSLQTDLTSEHISNLIKQWEEVGQWAQELGINPQSEWDTGPLGLLREQLTQPSISPTIKEEILEKILEEKKQEISELEQELTALGEQLDENLERRLKVLTGADSVKDKQIEQLKREVQNLTEYASNLMAQKETRIKSLISESRSLKTQLELGQGRFRTVPLSDCERRTSKLDETLNCLLAFLAGYGTATGLNLWLGSLIPPESSPSSKHYGQRRN